MPRQARYRTGDQMLVRAINLSLIMRRLFENATLSRAALADITGLNKSTVSSLVQELHALDFVREAGINSSGVGRPSVMLELNPDAGLIISAELGVDFISVKCANFAAEILQQRYETTRPTSGQHTIIARLIALLRDVMARCRAECTGSRRVLGIAVGVPGLVEQRSGTLLFAPNLHWENVPLLDLLQETFPDVPVFIDNEANLAALGEYFFGAAKGHEQVLFISVGIGLGGAVVRAGQVDTGITGFAGEFGHMTMDPDGILCNCGNRGCWETQVSQAALFREVRRAIEEGAPSTLRAMTGDNLDALTVAQIVEAARNGDAVARAVLDGIGEKLGIGIASLVNALNPDLVLFGGPLSLAGEIVIPIIEDVIARRALRWHAQATRVMQAKHGADACVIGGVARVCQQILNDPAAFKQPAA